MARVRTNAAQFSRRLRQKTQKIEESTEDAIGDAAKAIYDELYRTTPVDTGHARDNWIVSTVPRTDTVEAAEQPDTDFELGSQLYIANNVRYVPRLNAGSSAKAPAGFFERAVQVGIQKLRNSKIVK